jgi:biotin/methionine sulfoxide reductase
MATGAWFDPPEEAGGPERHGNPNVLTLDIGTSPPRRARARSPR